MTSRLYVWGLLGLLWLMGLSGEHAAADPPPFIPVPDGSVLFLENQGQWPEAARFQASTRDGVLWLSDDALWLTQQVPGQGQNNIRLSFVGQNIPIRLEPFAPQAAVISYFQGTDASQWVGRVPVWGGVRVRALYPGVDLLLVGQKGQVIPLLVGSEAVGRITVRVEGVDEVRVRGRELLFATTPQPFTWPLPASLTPLTLDIKTTQTTVTQTLTRPFSAPPHTHLIGSPLIFGTYIGGQDTLPDYISATVLDAAGNVYSTGNTESPLFPTRPGWSPEHGIDVIMTKLNATGTDLIYAIHINPSAFNQPDYGYAILVNDAGEAYVAGEASSFDFPVTPDALDTVFAGGDAFFLKVAADGASLLYSTFLGGSDLDGVRSMAQDNEGNFYLTGQTWSDDYPTTAGAFDRAHNGLRDVFVTKLNPSGTAIIYSTFVGGEIQEQAQAIVASSEGQATITGWTNSTQWPTTEGAMDETFNGEFDAFVTRLNPTGTALVYSTFLGGSNEDRANHLVLHGDGRVTVTGSTLCPCPMPFPTTPGVYDPTPDGNYDGFVTQLTPAGDSLVFSTFLGGSNEDRGYGLALTTEGHIGVTGRTDSVDFPVTGDAFDDTLGGIRDGFVTVLNAAATTLTYGTFIGGINEEEANVLQWAEPGTLVLAGSTRSTDFPVTAGAYDTTLNGDYDLFILKLRYSDPPLRIFLPFLEQP